MLSYRNYVGIASLLTVATTKAAPTQVSSTFAIYANLLYALTDPGLMAWGLGLLLFGWVGCKSNVLPNWFSILGLLGGVSGILASLAAPPLGSTFALVAILMVPRIHHPNPRFSKST